MKHSSKLVCKSIIATAVLSSALMNPMTAYSSKLPPSGVTLPEPATPKSTSSAPNTGIVHTGPNIMSPVPSIASSSNGPPRKQLALPAPSDAAPDSLIKK